jgi:predicted transcriptional regulator
MTLLAQPLAGDPAKGPFTVTSIKVHQQIWERLGHVATITGRAKQDLVTEALLDLFAKIQRTEAGG